MFDLEDPGIQADPYSHYRWLRANAPVYETSIRGQTVWVLSRYDDIVSVLKDPATFSSQTAALPMMLLADPPDHTRLRRSVARAFTPRAIADLSPRIEELHDIYYSALLGNGGGDVVDHYAARLPIAVIGEVVGVPTDQWDQLRHWSEDMIRTLGAARGRAPDPRAAAGVEALKDYVNGVLEGYRETPNQTIASALVELELSGSLTHEEVLYFCLLLFVAGHSTTMSLLTSGLATLAEKPELLQRLHREPDLVDPFVEEVLRYRPSLQRLSRVTSREVAIRGVTIPQGGAIRLLIGSANRDEAHFANGDSFDIDRPNYNHLAFGNGIHVCIGAPLARLEARIAFRDIVRRTGRVAFDQDCAPEPIVGGTTSEYGHRVLPLRLWAR